MSDKIATDEQKLEKVIEFLTESHLDSDGGYPYDYSTHFRGYIVVASLEYDGSTQIDVYKKRDLIRWYDRAIRFQKHYPEEDFKMAMMETDES